MITIVDAIRSLCPDAQFSIVNSSYAQLTWLSPTIRQPSELEIEQEIKRLEEIEKANEYQRLRAQQYPSIQEQLDMLYWDKVNGTTSWQEAISAVKLAYPKPGE